MSCGLTLDPVNGKPDLTVDQHVLERTAHVSWKNFAAYALRDAQGNQVMSGRKQGYALVDVQRYCADAEPWNYYAPMGISAGWSDSYTLDVACQWVDVTDVPDGTSTLQVSVDTRDIVDEGTVHPNTVSFPVRPQGDTVTVLP